MAGRIDWNTILNGQTALVLAVRPGDETARFGGLLAATLAAGRPPFVAILTDGGDGAGRAGKPVAMRRERDSRAATAALGLNDDRLLFVGLFDGTMPADGPLFDTLVAALDLVTWRNDCRVLVTEEGGTDDHAAAAVVARAVSARTGLPVVLRLAGPAERYRTV